MVIPDEAVQLTTEQPPPSYVDNGTTVVVHDKAAVSVSPPAEVSAQRLSSRSEDDEGRERGIEHREFIKERLLDHPLWKEGQFWEQALWQCAIEQVGILYIIDVVAAAVKSPLLHLNTFAFYSFFIMMDYVCH